MLLCNIKILKFISFLYHVEFKIMCASWMHKHRGSFQFYCCMTDKRFEIASPKSPRYHFLWQNYLRLDFQSLLNIIFFEFLLSLDPCFHNLLDFSICPNLYLKGYFEIWKSKLTFLFSSSLASLILSCVSSADCLVILVKNILTPDHPTQNESSYIHLDT